MATRRQLYHVAVVAIAWLAAFHGVASGQTRVDSYLRELKTLDTSRPDSTCIARDSLRRLFPVSDVDEREEMFRAFRAFYIYAVNSTAGAFLARMEKYVDDYERWMESEHAGDMQQFLRARPDIAEAGSKWFQCGFSMEDGEGSLLPMEDSAILLSFADKLGPSLASYVRFRANEDRERVANDAALQLSWEQLRLRLGRWEAFEISHRDLPEAKSEMEPTIDSLVRLFLFGSPNTPTFDSHTGRIEPELVAAWNKFATLDRSSRYHALISSLVTNVNEQGQTITQTDRPLFAKFGMADNFDPWWRLVQLRLTER